MLHWVPRTFRYQHHQWVALWCSLGLVVCASSMGCRSRSKSSNAAKGNPRVVKGGVVAPRLSTSKTNKFHSRYHSIRIGGNIKPEARLQKWLQPYRTKLQARMSKVLVKINTGFTRKRPESTLGNLVADICMAKLHKMGVPVDVFVTNLGGIRNDLGAGAISVSKTYEILPFENALVATRVTGRDLQAIMKRIAKRGGEPIAGATLHFAKGSATVIRTAVAGKPIQPNRKYMLGTNDYLVTTGFLRTILKGKRLYRTGLTLRETFQWGLKAKAVSLQPRLDGRVKKVLARSQP